VASNQQKRFALLAIGLGTSLPAADSAVNVALPAIAEALLSEPSAIRWTVIVYVLTYACLMMLLGAWGDRQGYWRVFRLGLWTGALAYGICAMASSYAVLLIGRGLQGFSSALLLSVGPALMVKIIGDDRREQAVAAYGTLSSAAAAFGPLIGGLMIYMLGWAGAFWFRLPTALLAMLCLGLAKYFSRSTETLETNLGLTEGSRHEPAFAKLKGRSSRYPRMDEPSALQVLARSLRHQCSAGLLKGHALHAWAQSCGFTSMLFVPFLMMNVMHQSAAVVGFVLFAWPAGMAIGNSLGPRLMGQTGLRDSFRIGLFLLALGGFAMALICAPLSPQHGLDPDGMRMAMVVALLIQGLGLGIVQMIYTHWVLEQSAPSERGVAGAASLTSRTLGVIVTAWFWPEMIEFLMRQLAWTWSEVLGLLYLLAAISLLGLLSQMPRQSLRM
jgi:MFS family permease